MQAERTTLEAAMYYQRFLADAMPVLVMMADPDGTVNFFNREWFTFTGQAPFERDSDRDWRGFLHPEDAEGVAAGWAQAVTCGQDVIDMEYRLKHAPSGDYRWVKARATAFRDPVTNEVIQWIGTAMDVDDAGRAADTLERIADAYQTASLPDLRSSLDGLSLSVAYRASTRDLSACGDWYDAFPVDDGTAICIGDVAGHGLEAATLMMKYRQSVRAIALRVSRLKTGSVASMLRSVEDGIDVEHPHVMATAFFGVIDTARRKLSWSNAGHVPPLLVRHDGTTEFLYGADPPLGARFDQERTVRWLSLEGLRCIILYTDGLVEASRNITEGMEWLRAHAPRAIESVQPAQTLLDFSKPESLNDDVAILTVGL